ncbi:prolyl oligopeptidase family serine peptidase [Streptomyces sp. NBC_00285]|uniref:S9 family peptidase n=1 Tax=Streptomyces sp. NBC_00285 TaxID=2975700 RepID=UPI002E2A621C|nr:alpha/beta fold hydrolase [Streptomyces sp. NBC_00285]
MTAIGFAAWITTGRMTTMVDNPSTFHHRLIEQPRLTGLTLAPDGTRLVASVQRLGHEGSRYVSELWEVDPAGERESRPVAGSVQGDRAPEFAGTLLLLSDRESHDSPGASVWALSENGEAERIAHHPGGVTAFTAAARSATLAYSAALLPGTVDARTHGDLLQQRRRSAVSAVLHETTPTRADGVDLGPGEPHTFLLHPDAPPVDAGGQGLAGGGDMALSPDATVVAYTRAPTGSAPDTNTVVIADAATGGERHALSRPGHQYYRPVFTADGTRLICQRQREETYDSEWRVTLVAFDPVTGEETDLLPDFDNWPWPGRAIPSPIPGDATVWFTGDERGHCPIFRLDPDGTVTRLTASGAYTSLCVTPDAATLYALRSTLDSPPQAVRLDAATADQHPVSLRPLGDLGTLPGTLTEVHTTGDDGFALRGWLVLPEGARAEHPAPLLVAVHGGPQGSWSGWPWQWNPWPFAARGYAVLLPDPALSSGYGQRMQERGRGRYGGRPYSDVIALTDAALDRADLDATRTALAGFSFGGYLANRTATLTDRFRALVSHAGMWNLEAFQGDTDMHSYFRKIYGDPRTMRERYDADSPHLGVANLTTPTLIVHGGKDYRVPVGQSLALHHDLQRQGVPAKFLYFPEESHGVEAPHHLGLLYETALNFLDHHVLGAQWRRPPLL